MVGDLFTTAVWKTIGFLLWATPTTLAKVHIILIYIIFFLWGAWQARLKNPVGCPALDQGLGLGLCLGYDRVIHFFFFAIFAIFFFAISSRVKRVNCYTAEFMHLWDHLQTGIIRKHYPKWCSSSKYRMRLKCLCWNGVGPLDFWIFVYYFV